MDAFKDFLTRTWTSVTMAEPELRKRRLTLAIENGNDLLAGELVGMVQRLGSEFVGICANIGNGLRLAQWPDTIAETFASYTYSIHLKDAAVKETGDGFAFSEVPLGRGAFDVARAVQTLRRTRPEARLFLDTKIGDPVQVDCLRDSYWASMENGTGKDLAHLLAMIRARQTNELPRRSGLEELLEKEEDGVKQSLAWARDNLGL